MSNPTEKSKSRFDRRSFTPGDWTKPRVIVDDGRGRGFWVVYLEMDLLRREVNPWVIPRLCRGTPRV